MTFWEDFIYMIFNNAAEILLLVVFSLSLITVYDCLFIATYIILVLVFRSMYPKIKQLTIGKNEFMPKDAVIVTGCDSGLGYGLALHCQSLGATVLAAVHKEDSLGAIKLKQSGITVLPLDVTIKSSVNSFCESAAKIIDMNALKLRAVVNNAGVMVFGEFEWQTEQQILDQININLVGTMNVTQRVLPIVRSHRSRIIFVSSHCALESLPGVAVYGATKAGLLAFATSLRVELKKCHVPVISFIPGSFTTESNILGRQKEHFQQMRNNMNDECKDFYGDYFDRYEQYLLSVPVSKEPVKLSNANIFEVFENCIFDAHPETVYKCEPLRYQVYLTLCKISPPLIRDYLIERFVSMPQWKSSD